MLSVGFIVVTDLLNLSGESFKLIQKILQMRNKASGVPVEIIKKSPSADSAETITSNIPAEIRLEFF